MMPIILILLVFAIILRNLLRKNQIIFLVIKLGSAKKSR